MSKAAPLFLLALMFSCSKGTEDSFVEVEKRSFEITVPGNGEMASSNTVRIGCPLVPRTWQFTINFLAPEGKHIEKGQMVLGFDDKKLQNDLQLFQGNLREARKNLEKTQITNENLLEDLKLSVAEAKMNLQKAERKIQISDDELSLIDQEKFKIDHRLSQSKLEMAMKKVEAHRINMESQEQRGLGEIEKLEKKVAQLQRSIEDMKVKAPKSGMVVYVSNWRGEKPVVGSTIYMGDSILEIPDLNQMIVKALIREPDAGNVKVGQPVRVTLDANTDRTFQGRVSELGQLFRKKSWDQPYMVFDASVEIQNPDPDLMRPGMKAKIFIISEFFEDSLVVPLAAIVHSGHGPNVFVQSRFGAREARPVQLGQSEGQEIQILNGLEEGERIWLP